MNAKEEKERKQFSLKMRAMHGELENAINKYNDTVDQTFSILNSEVEIYNEFIEEIKSFLEEIIEKEQAKYDDRSESWQESEKGDKILEEIEALQEALDQFAEIEIFAPDEIEIIEDLNEHQELIDKV